METTKQGFVLPVPRSAGSTKEELGSSMSDEPRFFAEPRRCLAPNHLWVISYGQRRGKLAKISEEYSLWPFVWTSQQPTGRA